MNGGPILVFGARGQIGREFVALATARRAPVVALSRADADITNETTVRTVMDIHRPSAVANAAGYTAVSNAEREPESRMSADSATATCKLSATGIGALRSIACST